MDLLYAITQGQVLFCCLVSPSSLPFPAVFSSSTESSFKSHGNGERKGVEDEKRTLCVRPAQGIFYFCAHSFGWNSITWLCFPAARKTGKCSPSACLREKFNDVWRIYSRSLPHQPQAGWNGNAFCKCQLNLLTINNFQLIPLGHLIII